MVGGEFPKRHGFRESPVEVIPEDAPAALRAFVLRHVYRGSGIGYPSNPQIRDPHPGICPRSVKPICRPDLG